MDDTSLFYIILMPIIALIVSVMVYRIMYKNPNSTFGGKRNKKYLL